MEKRFLQLLVSSKISLLPIADYQYMRDEKGKRWGKGVEQNPLNLKRKKIIEVMEKGKRCNYHLLTFCRPFVCYRLDFLLMLERVHLTI